VAKCDTMHAPVASAHQSRAYNRRDRVVLFMPYMGGSGLGRGKSAGQSCSQTDSNEERRDPTHAKCPCWNDPDNL
jgi:hypothetical protein